MSAPKHTFPCDYLVKIIAVKNDNFPSDILEIINNETTLIKHELTPSKNDNYLSLSVNLYLKTEQELEIIYQKIKNKPYIKMIL